VTATTPAPPRPEGTRRVTRRARYRLSRVLEFVALIVGIVAIWALAVRVVGVNEIILPDPLKVAQTGYRFAGFILSESAFTFTEALIGFGLSVVFGMVIGLGVCYLPLFRRLVLPSIAALNSTPAIVVAPIFVIWLGVGIPSKVAMAFLISFFPVVINSARGLSDVEPELLDFYRMMRANEWQIFLKLRVPSSLPALFDGMKLTLPISVIGAIIGEFVASRSGIGHQILVAYSNYNTPFVFAAVITVAVASTLLFQALRAVERYLLRWQEA